MKNYILDTSALLTFIENEAGVEDVEKLLLDAIEGKIQLFNSVAHVNVGFFRGAELADPVGLLEGTGASTCAT